MPVLLSTSVFVLPGHFMCSRLHARFWENNEALERKPLFTVRQLRVPDSNQINTLKSLYEVQRGLPDGNPSQKECKQ